MSYNTVKYNFINGMIFMFSKYQFLQDPEPGDDDDDDKKKDKDGKKKESGAKKEAKKDSEAKQYTFQLLKVFQFYFNNMVSSWLYDFYLGPSI